MVVVHIAERLDREQARLPTHDLLHVLHEAADRRLEAARHDALAEHSDGLGGDHACVCVCAVGGRLLRLLLVLVRLRRRIGSGSRSRPNECACERGRAGFAATKDLQPQKKKTQADLLRLLCCVYFVTCVFLLTANLTENYLFILHCMPETSSMQYKRLNWISSFSLQYQFLFLRFSDEKTSLRFSA